MIPVILFHFSGATHQAFYRGHWAKKMKQKPVNREKSCMGLDLIYNTAGNRRNVRLPGSSLISVNPKCFQGFFTLWEGK